MRSDSRIKRLLKRYPKNSKFCDASADVSEIEIEELLRACHCENETDLAVPRELDNQGLFHLSNILDMEFDSGDFDYFLHAYVRTEFVPSYYKDSVITSKPAPENGPPGGKALPEGSQWLAVRPQNGREQFEAHEISAADPGQKLH